MDKLFDSFIPTNSKIGSYATSSVGSTVGTTVGLVVGSTGIAVGYTSSTTEASTIGAATGAQALKTKGNRYNKKNNFERIIFSSMQLFVCIQTLHWTYI